MMGQQQYDYLIFLFNPVSEKFEFSQELSDLPNIYTDNDINSDMVLMQNFNTDGGGFRENTFIWGRDKHLYKTIEKSCLANYSDSDPQEIISFTRKLSIYDESGDIINSAEDTSIGENSICDYDLKITN